MAQGDIFKLSIVSTFTGNDQIVNNLHYVQLAAVTDPPAQDLADRFLSDVIPSYLNLLSTRIVVQLLEVRQVLGGLGSYDLTVGDNGNLSSDDIVPLQSAPLISWRTGLAGRAHRGRTFLPPIPEGNQDAGNLDTSYKNLMGSFAAVARLINDGVADVWQLCIFSTELDGEPRVPPVGTPVTSWIIRDNMGSQRRRRQGVGS
jgi:hypothetical protein